MVKVCMILYTPRSGSNNVCQNLFNFNNKSIYNFWELFNKKVTHGNIIQNILIKKYGENYDVFIKKNNLYVDTIKYLKSLAEINNKKYLFFKVSIFKDDYQISIDNFNILVNSNVIDKVIIIHRKNTIDQFISWEKCMYNIPEERMKRGYSDQKHEPKVENPWMNYNSSHIKISFNILSYLKFKYIKNKIYDTYENVSNNIDTYRLSYEDISNQEILLNKLQIVIPDVKLFKNNSTLKKQDTTILYSDKIKNYNDYDSIFDIKICDFINRELKNF